MKINIAQKVRWFHVAPGALMLMVATFACLQQSTSQLPSSAAALTTAHRQRYATGQVLGTHASAKKSTDKKSQPATSTAASQTVASNPSTDSAQPAKQPAVAPKSMPVATPSAPTAPAKAPVAVPAPAAVPSSSDIASEATCPGQLSTANAAVVLACMTAYARTSHGIAAVSNNAALVTAANAKAQDMKNCGYGHTACGRAFNYWFAPSGYTGRCTAENIAQGQRTIGEVFVAWMNSAGHRTNILNPSYLHIGGAVTAGPSGNLWVMELGGC